MTDATALLELAARVEGGELTDDLTMAIVWLDYRTLGGIGLGVNYDPDLWMQRHGIDPLTSLDAAMTLMPVKWKLRHIQVSAPCADDRKWNAQLHGGREGEDCFTAFAATPALALTAAALRAHAALVRP